MWVRDFGHRAALLSCLLCFGLLAPSSSSSPSLFSTLPVFPSARSICLGVSVDQSALYIWPLYSEWVVMFMRSGTVGDICPEVWGVRRWRVSSVTPCPVLVVAVEWPDRTARSAPRPFMVSSFLENYCWLIFHFKVFFFFNLPVFIPALNSKCWTVHGSFLNIYSFVHHLSVISISELYLLLKSKEICVW